MDSGVEYELKNGQRLFIRSIDISDVNDLLNYINSVKKESDFLLYGRKDSDLSYEDEIKYVNQIIKSKNEIMRIGFVNDILVGAYNLIKGNVSKNKHMGQIAVSVRKDFWNIGIGTAFMKDIDKEAERLGLEALKLEYCENNIRGENLYKKAGFIECGRVPYSFKDESGNYISSIMMVKKLSSRY